MNDRLRLTAILTGIITLSGCGSDAPANTSENSDSTLTVWVYGADYEPLITEYEAAHGDVTIDLVRRDKDDHQLSLFTALSAGGGAPDVTAVDWDDLDTYRSAANQFTDLTDFGANDHASDFLEWAFEAGRSKDGESLIGVPVTISPSVMHYNRDLFKAAGLPDDPDAVSEHFATWSDLKEAADKILRETGSAFAPNPDLIYHAKRDQLDSGYFSEESDLQIQTYPPIESAFMDTAEWIAQDYFLLHDHDSESWQEATANSDFATLIGDRTMTKNLKEDAPASDSWRMAQIPGGAGNRGGTWLSVPSQSNHPEEAYALIEWLTAPEQQLRLYEQEGILPATPSVYEEDTFMNTTDPFFGNQAVGNVFAAAAKNMNPHHRGRNYNSVDEEILIGLDNVFLGALPEDEWEEILQRVNRRVTR